MVDLRLYVDSSVWNAVYDDHVPQMQAQTQAFFDRVGVDQGAETFISEVVLLELGRAPADRLERLGELIRAVGPTILELDDESAGLAEAYVRHGVVTAGHLMDAQHVAVATVGELDVLVSWNYRHLVNRRRREAFNGVNAIQGYRTIDIVTPPEVFDE